MGKYLARLIGTFRLFDPSGRDVTPRGRKTCGLLACLLLGEHGVDTRARLATLLWSESDEEHARASLRQCIKELRGLSQDGGLIFADKTAVGVDLALVERDIDRLGVELAGQDAKAALRWLEGPEPALLQDLDNSDPLFDKWLQVRRSDWADATVGGLLALLDDDELPPAEQAQVAKAVLRLDPFSERAAEIQIIALFESAGLQPAIAYFESYQTLLAEEYEIRPSARLTGLVEMLRERAARPPRPAAPAAPPPPAHPAPFLGTPFFAQPLFAGPVPGAAGIEPAPRERPRPEGGRPETPTIAVVQAQGDGGYADHIAGAFATELAATLGRFREWSVLRVEPEGGEGMAEPGPLLARLAAHGIEFALLVEPPLGRGETTGGDFQVSCHDCIEGALLVAQRFRARPNEWNAVFNQMSARLASHLNVAIATARLHKAAHLSEAQQPAYEFWLDGQRLSVIWQPETEEAAIRCYEKAIALAPQLPHAYSSLAAVLNSRWIVLPGWPNDAADRERALQLAQHAVRLDNLDHRCQANLAWSHLLARRWEVAELHFRLAHDLNPANPNTLISYALASAFMGNHKQARTLCARAFDICALREPYFFGYRATIAFLGGDHAECLAAIAEVPELFPDIDGWAAAGHAALGHDEEAGRSAARFLASMRARWAGPTPVADAELVAWFKTVFPLRRERDRRLLAQAIDRAVARMVAPPGGGRAAAARPAAATQ